MKILIRVFSEITIKSPSVRKNLIRLLRRNLQGSLSQIQKGVQVKGSWDAIEIEAPDDADTTSIFSILQNTPGIEWSAEAIEFLLQKSKLDTKNKKNNADISPLRRGARGVVQSDTSNSFAVGNNIIQTAEKNNTSEKPPQSPFSGGSSKIDPTSQKIFDNILEKVLENMEKEIKGKTFCVRVQRTGTHDFSSLDAEKYIGGGINQKIESAKVQLKKPEVEVSIIIKDQKVFLRRTKKRGVGGYPVGSQGKVLCLLSGGFDSGVVAHMMMNRGCKVDYLFCNLGGVAHESGVRKMAHHLWKTTSASFPVKMFSVPFEPIIAELLEKTDEGLRGVLLKRMMLRAAEKIARTKRYKALITGESLAQVSSQTLQNLKVIDDATNMLVLRPLTAIHKPEIIEKAKKIGTAEIATSMPEYCGVVSSRPTVSAKTYEVLREEEKFDMRVLEHAVEDTMMNIVGEFTEEDFAIPEVETVNEVKKNEVIIDIREAEEIKELPFSSKIQNLKSNILEIPFYEIQEKFDQISPLRRGGRGVQEDENNILNPKTTYLLYCERGVISRAQAELLIKKGFRNVKVLRK